MAFGLVVSGERARQRKGLRYFLGGAGPTVCVVGDRTGPYRVGSAPLVSWSVTGKVKELSVSLGPGLG